jgi:hypothetical protein
MTVVEAVGGMAKKKAKGYWIHFESTTALDEASLDESIVVLPCVPGNCISCDDAAYPDSAKNLQDYPLAPGEKVAKLAQKLGQL